MVAATTGAGRTRGHKKKQRTRSQLIAAGVEVIASRGEAFSIGDVTERAGVSHGTFYNYFDDRDALLAAVIPEVLTVFTVQSALLVDDDPAVRFASITALALQRAVTVPQQTRLLLRLDAVQRAIVESSALDPLRGDLAAGFGSGRFLVGPDAATLDVIVGALLFASRRMLDEAVTDRYLAGVVAQLLRSLGVAAAEAHEIADHAVRAAAPRSVPRETYS